MNPKRLWVAAAIIAVVIFVGFVLSVPHTRDVEETAFSQKVTTVVPFVTLHDSFKKGLHTITGSIEAPNACTDITAQAFLSGDASSPAGIVVALSMPEDSGICLQVPTRMNFSVTISAPAQLPITATVNGLAATTTKS
ncbi:hypothetical protein A2118_01130 [Candidatus Kaiserbacteria bacterium GWA2_50_9]|uniref:Uncharacterized protein n=1 Tax=Candidatus Kaiserbacteria bacterium GWA2_50_9 TaxID=1798474 RepID=A0A1F6BSM6_9BACT|nr:MAG: hypothetical protein A2118_01130 [Candidatus Kaiserbacteria bacterium GWA2_50_9]